MSFKAFRGQPFTHSHENHAFNTLYDMLSSEWEHRDEELFLFGNFFVAGKEFDALIIKNNAIIVIDFKNFGGAVTFSENGPWYCDNIVVKGGNSRNPFIQIRNNKFALLDYIKGGHFDFPSKPNLGHIAGLVLFQGDITFDDSQIPQQIKSWFHVCDSNKAIRTIDGIASAGINLSAREIELFAEKINAPEYFPDGQPIVKEMQQNSGSPSASFIPAGSQKNALLRVDDWIESESCAFVLKGMSSTGKKTLLREILQQFSTLNKSTLLVAPNARLAARYTSLGLGEFCSIYQTLYSTKSDGVVKKSNGVELARHPIVLTSEQIRDKIVVIVEAHLISNSYFDMESAVFGTGHMVNDLLSVIGSEPCKFFIVGDPYQLSRGDLEQCLLSGQAFRDKELAIDEIELDQQIESEPKELHEFQFELAQQMQLKQFTSLPEANNDIVSQIENSPSIGVEISSGPHYAVYLTALNSVAHKVNLAVKKKVLRQKNPLALNAGDLIDFHTSSPVLNNKSAYEIETNNEWIHSGQIATVTDVDEHIDTFELTLKGRDVPTVVRIGALTCKIPTLGDVRIAYVVDYLHAEKPELTQDQLLVLNIMARENATQSYEGVKSQLEKITDKRSVQYKSEKKRYNELIQNHIACSPLLNAARIRYAYAMTVHRAQGRQWSKVFLDASRGPSGEAITNDGYFRFLYTASMSAEHSVMLLRYPKLTPLYNTQFIPNKNCVIGPISLSKGFAYQMPEKQVLESFEYPVGFSSDISELRAICFNVVKRLEQSDWRISEIKHHSYQELYTFEHSAGEKLKVRFTYDKNITVKTLAFPDTDIDSKLVEELKSLLEAKISLPDKRLNCALQAIGAFVEPTAFNLVTAQSRSEWEMLVGLTNSEDSVTLKVYVGKDGLISKIMPEKASSEAAIHFFRERLNEQ
ncbi:NERD domain-containing protein/DEAD/DEAH box helicase [Alteromonas sp. ASW11-130]|uniref:NERD domain-containing protein/DEAD/DEAH box helicase n=1 Tax=Alteromonas sp. ASW11-130 TaxID=3015775 RepID=UPI002241B793|nr:NERD domain-containing protein/DEAD/DEAH box helicase [Alteromonas sp. ASW11-130]MCW8093216.1 NERD domain-containing protein [Alteromonas sp. ASW11-130]